jgi:quinol monooxygenase YgiN
MSADVSLNSINPAYGTQLTLIAFIRAKKGKGAELGHRLAGLVDQARAEPGNINYDLHRSDEDGDVWVLYENWKDPSDLTAHFEYPYMKKFLATLPELLDGEMDLRRCTMVSRVAATA